MENRFEIPQDVLKNLPEDVKNQLSSNKKLKEDDNAILAAIRTYGGTASLDQIIVYFWNTHGQMLNRGTLTGKINKLMKINKLKPFGKKGVYSVI